MLAVDNVILGVALGILFFSSTIYAALPNVQPAPSPFPIEVSTINLPVTVALASLAQKAEPMIPTQQTTSGAWTVIAHDVAGDVGEKHIIQRDALALSAQGSQLTIATTVRYWLKVAQNIHKPWPMNGEIWTEIGSCGVGNNDTPLQTASIKLTSALKIDPAYHLTSSTTGSVLMLNSCKITKFNISLDNKVSALFQGALNSAAATIDQQMPQLTNIRPQCITVWQSLQSPISLGNHIWLSINPQTLQISQPSGSGPTLALNVGLTAYPKIILDNQPASNNTVLPSQLDITTPKGNIHIALEANLPFKEASEQINERLAGRHYNIDQYKLEIVGADVYGTPGATVLHLKTSGSLEADIYLTGQPAFDPVNNVFSIERLDFDIKTQNLLAKAASWLLHSQIRQHLASESTVHLSTRIQDVKRQLETVINRPLNPHVDLHGKVEALRCLGITATPSFWNVIVSFDGAVTADIH
jgi:Domain of unknown function (DUF4403)